ncbi:hypothetical protein GGS20DRAFT_460365 [Poronia punctata]|nr:hypothetical protein GGS20DRAFT_460365 [Poronia punctata]
MPTPSRTTQPRSAHQPLRAHGYLCPEDVYTPGSWRPDEDELDINADSDAQTSSSENMSASTPDALEFLASPPATANPSSSSPGLATESATSETTYAESSAHKQTEDLGEAAVARAGRHFAWCNVDSATTELDRLEDADQVAVEHDEYQPSMGFDYSNIRIFPTSPSSYLRPRSRFTGTQASERQVYDVQVEIKYVDLRESFLCGYLKIQGLTEDNPTLTTYFEGEIIGNQYDFVTRHKGWGATEKVDLNHWSKFAAFRKYSKAMQKGGRVKIPNFSQCENIFMRWKEHFLVPDHRVTSLNGASFEGFYYICFNQIKGSVSGIYFHHKSEHFQQLELNYVKDNGCFRNSAIEFR